MRKLIIAAALIASTSAHAAPARSAECAEDITECYSTMQAACPRGFNIIDRNSFYGDGLVRELPPRTLFLSQQYNQYLYSCE